MANARFLTSDFARLRALWGAVCLASLAVWYFERLKTLTWPRGVLLIGTLTALSCSEEFLVPRLKRYAGLTMALTVAEILVLVWLLWFVTR